MARMPAVYVSGPGGAGPVRWQDDVTGVLPMAIHAFIDEGLGRAVCMPEQVELVRDYCEYYINAPCWDFGTPEEAPDFYKEFTDLRERIKTLRTAKEIAAWIWDALKVGIDPL